MGSRGWPSRHKRENSPWTGGLDTSNSPVVGGSTARILQGLTTPLVPESVVPDYGKVGHQVLAHTPGALGLISI